MYYREHLPDAGSVGQASGLLATQAPGTAQMGAPNVPQGTGAMLGPWQQSLPQTPLGGLPHARNCVQLVWLTMMSQNALCENRVSP